MTIVISCQFVSLEIALFDLYSAYLFTFFVTTFLACRGGASTVHSSSVYYTLYRAQRDVTRSRDIRPRLPLFEHPYFQNSWLQIHRSTGIYEY